MKRDMESLQAVLWEEFEAAAARQKRYNIEDTDYSRESYPGNFAIENRKALGELGQALALVNRELRAEKYDAERQKIDDDIGKGIVRDISTLPAVRLKKPEGP